MPFTLPFIIMILGMIGGQLEKGARRFGIAGASITAGLVEDFRKKKKPKDKAKRLLYLLLIPTLTMGYGEHSWIRNHLGGSEFLTRLVYAVLLSIPFMAFGVWWAAILLIPAFQIRAGKLGSVGKFDILIEDIVRYLSLGILISITIYR